MPSSKDKVTSYLEDDKFQAIKQFCTENDFSYSEGVSYLIEKHLIASQESPETVVIKHELLENQIMQDEKIAKIDVQTHTNACFLEKLQEKISFLEEQLDLLHMSYRQKPTEYFTDEQIAAVTGQSEWKVRLWRHNVQKPRGSRIKKNLEPYIVKNGKWASRD